jgi:chromosome segregation ATPase
MIVLIWKKRWRELTDKIERSERIARESEQAIDGVEDRLARLESKQRVASADRHGLACQIREIRNEIKKLRKWQYTGK